MTLLAQFKRQACSAPYVFGATSPTTLIIITTRILKLLMNLLVMATWSSVRTMHAIMDCLTGHGRRTESCSPAQCSVMWHTPGLMNWQNSPAESAPPHTPWCSGRSCCGHFGRPALGGTALQNLQQPPWRRSQPAGGRWTDTTMDSLISSYSV